MTEQRYTVDYMWGGLDAEFRARLEALIQASGGGISLTSGYRSNEHQADLYQQAIIRYGEADAGRWAAPPGRSNHNRGLAADLGFSSDQVEQWAHANAPRFGLQFPMNHEPWHIEPFGLNQGQFQGAEPWREAYTPFEDTINPVDQVPDMMVELDRMLRGVQPSAADVAPAEQTVNPVENPGVEMANEGVDRMGDEGPDITEVTDG